MTVMCVHTGTLCAGAEGSVPPLVQLYSSLTYCQRGTRHFCQAQLTVSLGQELAAAWKGLLSSSGVVV
jgi:hypothetical protein